MLLGALFAGSFLVLLEAAKLKASDEAGACQADASDPMSCREAGAVDDSVLLQRSAFTRRAAGGPCKTSESKQVYGAADFKDGGKVSTWDNHGGKVYCADDNHDKAIQWNTANTAVTIEYLGKKGGKSSTCYVTTPNFCQMGLCHAQTWRNLTSQGYVSADITLNKVSEGLDANDIWPAFWILNYEAADWPKGGELDIAERQNGVTEEHIIVGPIDDDHWDVELMNIWPKTSMSLKGTTHNYGLEWHFVNEDKALNQLDFTIYLNGKQHGDTYSCFVADKKNKGCQYMFNAFSDGRIVTIFDADSHTGASSKQRYSMTVSNVEVYNVVR